MTNTELQSLMSSWMEGLEFVDEGVQYLTINVSKDNLRDLMFKLRDGDASFDYMFSLTAVDWGKERGIVYHLESTKYRHIVVVHVKTDDEILDSIFDIYPTANLNEREAYDLMGIKFTGHPDLRRLFLQDDWVGHPLRKDYVDEANMIVR